MPENVRRLLETGAPQPVTDDRDRDGRRAFAGRKATTENGTHSEHVEVARRDELDIEPLRHFTNTNAEGKLHPCHKREAIRARFDEIEIVRCRDVAKLAFGGARHHDAKTLGLRNGERAEQERVNDAEDGDIGADAEAETRDGYGSEAGPAYDPSKRPAQVLEASWSAKLLCKSTKVVCIIEEHQRRPKVAVQRTDNERNYCRISGPKSHLRGGR